MVSEERATDMHLGVHLAPAALCALQPQRKAGLPSCLSNQCLQSNLCLSPLRLQAHLPTK